MAARPDGQPSYRRPIVIYLLAIVAPALVLLYFGLQSVQRQREAITSLTLSNLRLTAEHLAADFEQRSWELARACLRDRELERVRPASGAATALEAARQVRTVLANVGQRHPVARHFFIVQGSTVRFPLLHAPLPWRPEEYVAREPGGVGQRFASLFAEAEVHELQHERLDLALSAYRRCYELPVSASLKALALARIARCYRKRHQLEAEKQTYRTLAAQYGDLYDPFHRPYRLIAGLERQDLVRTAQASSRDLAEMYRDLVTGRWELSGDLLDYFLSRLTGHLGRQASETEYLSHFKLARALQEGFRPQRPLRAGQVYAHAFTHGGIAYQTYYSLTEAGGEPDTLLGFAVDLDWISGELLPRLTRDLRSDDRYRVAMQAPQGIASPSPVSEARVRFNAVFPFWELSIAPGSRDPGAATARRQTAFLAGSTVLILAVLGLGVSLLVRDVSRELQMSRLRANFVSGVSHELKTPLTLIRLYGETLSCAGDLSEEERQRCCDIITRESDRLGHLIDTVLEFSRVDRGQKQYRLREGDIGGVIARTVDVYGRYLVARGFVVQMDLARQLPPICLDPDAVSQAVLNLLDNAAKYSGESRFIRLQLRAEDHQIVFEVEDRGIGIPLEERERIFQQFYRARGSGETGGYGVGLFLVRHIMDAHRGRVELESEPGRGSRFRLIFPYA